MISYLERVGRSTDVWLAVALLGAPANQTISTTAALSQRARRPFGCILCPILGVLVERHHCANTLNPLGLSTTQAALRGGLVMLAFISGVVWGVSALIHLI